MSVNSKTEFSHYVARVVVEKVEKTTIEGDQYNKEFVPQVKRDVIEVSNFTIKAPSMNEVHDQVRAHIVLVSDYE